MSFKTFLVFLTILNVHVFAFAKDIPVIVVPVGKITTSNLNLKLGDEVEFRVKGNVIKNGAVYIKESTPVWGVVTFLQANGWFGEYAKITIENLKTQNIYNQRVKLNGSIYKAGSDHEKYLWFLMCLTIRGGEVQIKPEKDSFTLYLKSE